MSIKLMTLVWDQSPVKGTALLVHLALADHANDEGVCWPSQLTLAQKARCSTRHVRNTIGLLSSLGYVTIVQESDGRKNHQYRLTFREKTSGDTGNPQPKNRHITINQSAVSLSTQLSKEQNERISQSGD